MGFGLEIHYHFTPHKSWFVKYKSLNGGVTTMTNNHLCEIASIGMLHIQLDYGLIFILNNVLHVFVILVLAFTCVKYSIFILFMVLYVHYNVSY